MRIRSLSGCSKISGALLAAAAAERSARTGSCDIRRILHKQAGKVSAFSCRRAATPAPGSVRCSASTCAREMLHVALVVDDVVGDGAPRGARGLCREPCGRAARHRCHRAASAAAAAFRGWHPPAARGRTVPVCRSPPAGERRSAGRDRRGCRDSRATSSRMAGCVMASRSLRACGVREHDAPQPGAVQRAIGQQHLRAEARDDAVQHRRGWRDRCRARSGRCR